MISFQQGVWLASLRSIVSFNYRYNPIINKIQEVSKIAALGELNFFSDEFNNNSALTRKHMTWRDSARQNKSSGALGDLSCYLLDLFCQMAADRIRTDELRVVKGTRISSKSDGPVEVDDNGYIFGRAAGGAFFRIQASKADETNQFEEPEMDSESGLRLSNFPK